jgi:hypothetical protein
LGVGRVREVEMRRVKRGFWWLRATEGGAVGGVVVAAAAGMSGVGELTADGVLPDGAELLDADGFEEIVNGAVSNTLDDDGGVATGGHHDDGQVQREVHELEQAEAIHVGHVHV